MNKKPNSDRSTRAQRRRDEREVAKNPVPGGAQAGGQQLQASEVFAQLGEATFINGKLQQENARLRQQIEGLDAAIVNLNEMIEKLTPKPEPDTPKSPPEMMQRKAEEDPPLSEDEIAAHIANVSEPSEEELAEEELQMQAKQEAEEEQPFAEIINELPRDASGERAEPLED